VGKRKYVEDNDEYKPPTPMTSHALSKASVLISFVVPTECTSHTPDPKSTFTPSVGGLQISFGELCSSVKTLENKVKALVSENLMMKGWMETMMVTKEKMLVMLPALQREMQVFWDGMELQQLWVEVQHLECEVANAQVHSAELEATDSNGNDDGNDEAEVENEENEEPNTDIAVRSLMCQPCQALCADTSSHLYHRFSGQHTHPHPCVSTIPGNITDFSTPNGCCVTNPPA
jgi:hypothetical protein